MSWGCPLTTPPHNQGADLEILASNVIKRKGSAAKGWNSEAAHVKQQGRQPGRREKRERIEQDKVRGPRPQAAQAQGHRPPPAAVDYLLHPTTTTEEIGPRSTAGDTAFRRKSLSWLKSHASFPIMAQFPPESLVCPDSGVTWPYLPHPIANTPLGHWWAMAATAGRPGAPQIQNLRPLGPPSGTSAKSYPVDLKAVKFRIRGAIKSI
jgi:hypothetical protein